MYDIFLILYSMIDGNAHAVANGPQPFSARRFGDGLSAHCPAAAVGFIVTLKIKEQGSTTGKIGLEP
jgi:hypothetical protein